MRREGDDGGALTRRFALLAATAAAALAAVPAGAAGPQENVIGDRGAPITVVWYASVTCPHCKSWHDDVWPDFKVRYVDTGRVRFVVRELPTNPTPLAMAGFLVARCVRKERYFEVLDFLFRYQRDLLESYGARDGPAVREGLLEIASNFGVYEERFEACLRDQDEIARIQRIVLTGRQLYDVTGTPTFLIDGVTYGALGIEEMSAIIDPLLPDSG